ncbi:MAG: phosphoribosylamine--glycine ligase [Planctomycetota bacterium]|nr:phosphoribosylamine--glycine ligase [Planctomycetota bacterium]
MKILVVGGGGREHALCWKLAQSGRVAKLYCAPGNAGIALTRGPKCGPVECVDLGAENLDGLLRFARRERIDLTVVGPEAPLCAGIVDRWESEGLAAFGPPQRGAELEGSKTFTKTLLRKNGIPTADFQSFRDAEKAMQYCRDHGGPLVVKADGLAAGKGVVIAQTGEEAAAAVQTILVDGAFGQAGASVVIEEFLKGEEASILALTDGRSLALLPSAQDHKRAFDNDEGPNTGGMGAYSPAPVVTEEVEDRVVREILIPTLHALNREERPYKGVLYAGLMITEQGPKVLEYNVRFGDPECQCVIPRMTNDLVDVIEKILLGKLSENGVATSPDPAVCVVLASGGYPGAYAKGKPVTGLDADGQVGVEGVTVFHAGTARRADGQVVTSGGRVFGVTATAPSLEAALARAYEAAPKIAFEGAFYRKDIAARALRRR